MQIIGIARGAQLRQGQKFRATFGVSTYGDVLQFFLPASVDDGNLRRTAQWVYEHIPSPAAPAIAASLPTVNVDADAFTLDVRTTQNAARATVDQLAAGLDALVRGYTLVRLELVSAGETSNQATAARDDAASSPPASGVTIGATVADAAAGLGGWLGDTVRVVLIVGAIVLVSGGLGGTLRGLAGNQSARRGRRSAKAKT